MNPKPVVELVAKPTYHAVPRGLALFLGGFSLFNVLGGFHAAGFDANLWWIDLRAMPPIIATVFLLLSGVLLLAFGFRPPGLGWRRWITLGCVAALVLAAVLNTAKFYVLLMRGVVRAGIPIPLSFLLVIALVSILIVANRTREPARGWAGLLPSLGVCLGCVAGFPILQMLCFGKTDYREPADVAVVLGARVYADGRLSDALADRVRTGCRLYKDGLARKLIFSGGPGDGAIHETQAMKWMAEGLGVKPEDILTDEAGLNTQATVKNCRPLFLQLHASRILVVSHFYHLPRIKLAFQRAGWEVRTVPAKESYLLRQMPYNMAREVVALWAYYLRPAFTGC